MDSITIKNQITTLIESLNKHYQPAGYWKSELSSSALATAVAIFSLHSANAEKYKKVVDKGLHWLRTSQNSDGGWGDAPTTKSNLTTTLICWSALSIEEDDKVTKYAEKYICKYTKTLSKEDISKSLLTYYGNDHTFSAPILTMCALAGRLGKKPWVIVPQLPFELAIFPHFLFKILNLQVVSYAIPALIAIGIIKHKKYKSNFIWNTIRKLCIKKTLKKLQCIQPDSGGFLEAAPLTGFVIMSLVNAGFKDLKVVRKGCYFLEKNIRSNGSWAIDNNLDNWVTTLAINAIFKDNLSNTLIPKEQQQQVLKFIIKNQFNEIDIATKSRAGGWSWTHLSGAVPDADDTAGALIAINHLTKNSDDTNIISKIKNGIKWLLSIQNNDGGIPTFCRGWGKLPFDESCPDITAHTIQAFAIWYKRLDENWQKKIDKSLNKMLKYLRSSQLSDKSWLPLWFGNENAPLQHNHLYGTAQVIIGLKTVQKCGVRNCQELIKTGESWLIKNQNSDGSWGGEKEVPGTIEETSLAITALSLNNKSNIKQGLKWLIPKLKQQPLPSSPIGLYFASLWYDEKRYPTIFAIKALNNIVAMES